VPRWLLFVATNAVLLASVLAATGCSTHRSRGNDLQNAAHSLLPEQSRVLLEELGNCIELAPTPSCVQIYLLVDHVSLPGPVRAVDERARAAAWELRRKETLAGGVELRFRRGRFQAIVTLRTEYYRRNGCDQTHAKECGDVISVERS
jgi:hypothetical protein